MLLLSINYSNRQFQCYYCQSTKVVRKIEMHLSINNELKIEFENDLDYSPRYLEVNP